MDDHLMEVGQVSVLANMLQQAVQSWKSVSGNLSVAQGKEELAASLRLLQQLPSELHESQHDTAPVFTAFRDLFATLNSLFNSESISAEDQGSLSATVRDLLLALFVSTTPSTPSDPTSGYYLLLSATTRAPALPLPLLVRDALLLLFWIDTRLLNPECSLPKSKSQVTELLERSSSGNPEAGTSAAALLRGPGVPKLMLQLLEIAQGPEAPLHDPSICELHMDVAAWGSMTSSGALQRLLNPSEADEEDPASSSRSRNLMVAALELASSALRRINRVMQDDVDAQFGPLAVKSMAGAAEGVLQLGDVVLEAAAMSPHDPSCSKALLSAAEVYASARTLVASYGRLAGDDEASVLASRLRSQMSRASWLCTSRSGMQNGGGVANGNGNGNGNGYHPLAVLPWRWELGQPFVLQDEEGETGSMQLLRGILEVLAQLAGWCWRGGVKQPAQQIMGLPDMLPSSSEQQALALLLGRTFHVSACSDALGRMLLPLLADSLAAKQLGMEAPVYATLTWVLASMAACSSAGASTFSWLTSQVVDLLIHMYRVPPPKVQEMLMGGPATPARPCGDSLAVALQRLAAGLEGAQRSTRHELRRRLLQLFREVGLRAPKGGATAQWDLGALLPVVGAAFGGTCEQWASLKGLSVKSSHSLDFMEQMQRSQAAIIQMLRELWFHCASFKFTDASQWPPSWCTAAGIIASGTPALLVGSGPNRKDDVLERLRAELGVVVARAGPSATQANLSLKLATLLAPYAQGLPPPSTQIKAAFLLAVATAEDCRVNYAPLEQLRESSPLVLPQLYLQTAPANSEDSAWYRALLQHCCGVITNRLAALRMDETADPVDRGNVEGCAESVAGSLISALADSGGHSEGGAPPVVGVSQELLRSLLDSFPSLYWSRRCLDALLGELEEEEGDRRLGQLAFSTTATANLVWGEMRDWLRRASNLAPTRTEALLHACLSQITRFDDLNSTYQTQSGTGVAAAARRRGTELLATCATATQRSELAWLEVMADQGALAMGRKQHSLGMVKAMQRQLDEDGASTASLAIKLEEGIQEVLLASRRKAELEQQYLVAAAYLASQDALPPSHPAIQRLLHTLCHMPVQKFTVNMIKVAVFAWTWVSVAAPALEEDLLHQVATAWVTSAHHQLGLFSGLTPLPGDAEAEGVREEAERKLVAGIRCHQQWLTFFVELWNAAKDRGTSSQNVIFQVFGTLLHKSLSSAERLSRHPAAVAPRFRLLTLGLMYTRLRARHAGGACPDAVALLNDRILLAGLHWFTDPPSWHHACTQREAQERFLALRDFLTTLKAASQEATSAKLPTLTIERLQQTLTRLSVASTPFSSRPPSRSGPNGPAPSLPSFTRLAADVDRARVTRFAGGSDSGSEFASTAATAAQERAAGGVHPVWGVGCSRPGDLDRLQRLLGVLVKAEAERLEVWAMPRASTAAPPSSGVLQQLKDAQWKESVHIAWAVQPTLALMLLHRCSTSGVARAELEGLVAQHCKEPQLQTIPEAAMLLATPKAAKMNAPELEQLDHWAPASAVQGLQLLSSAAGSHLKVKAYCMRCLSTYPPAKLAFFLPQLVQGIRHDDDGQLSSFLIATAQACHVFAHCLIWGLMAEEDPPEEARNPKVKRAGWTPPRDFGLWGPAAALKERVLAALPPAALQYWHAESQYFGAINEISGILKELPPEDRRAKINTVLATIAPSRDDLYLPGCAEARVIAAVPGSGTPMPSAAKVPILVAFEVQEPSVSVPTKKALIFKVGDDVRQDVLALQVISVLKDTFQRCGLDLYLRPYGVMPTGYETGIIEVVPNAKSRSGVGEITEGGLYDYFQIQYGQPGSPRFEAARRAFILSEAGYAIASFLLQCKDRHNGNLLIDNEGHLVHIDFGFILEISPGGNMGFEGAAFKLSHEMTQLLDPGGQRNSAHFKLFEEYCIRGYLAARAVAEPILAIVALMKEAGLPCFGRGQPLDNLRARFHLELSEAQAAAFIRQAITGAYQRWSTGFYDYIQYWQNGIPR